MQWIGRIESRDKQCKIDQIKAEKVLQETIAQISFPILSSYPVFIDCFLVSPFTIARLNRAYLHHAGPTDVITFSYWEELKKGDMGVISLDEEKVVGEIFVAPAVAARRCGEYGCSFAEELWLYVIHGLLHLAGFDDQTPEDCLQMQVEQKKIIESIKRTQSLEEIVKWIPRIGSKL